MQSPPLSGFNHIDRHAILEAAARMGILTLNQYLATSIPKEKLQSRQRRTTYDFKM
jgi:hypothetical protein